MLCSAAKQQCLQRLKHTVTQHRQFVDNLRCTLAVS